MDKVIVVGVCLKNDQDEILMVREAKEEIKGLYNVPAGRLDPDESIFEGAIREAKEETGYDVKLDSILCLQYSESKSILKVIFNATIIGGNINFDPEEIMDVKWLPICKLEKMTKDEIRSYQSNMAIIKASKENISYPLNIIENIK